MLSIARLSTVNPATVYDLVSSSFVASTALSAILPVVTAFDASFVASTTPAASFTAVTASVASLSAVTFASLIFTVSTASVASFTAVTLPSAISSAVNPVTVAPVRFSVLPDGTVSPPFAVIRPPAVTTPGTVIPVAVRVSTATPFRFSSISAFAPLSRPSARLALKEYGADTSRCRGDRVSSPWPAFTWTSRNRASVKIAAGIEVVLPMSTLNSPFATATVCSSSPHFFVPTVSASYRANLTVTDELVRGRPFASLKRPW